MTYRFGLFEFSAEAGELRKGGRLLSLEPQPARALACLLARGGELVSRDDLKAAVWGDDTHVDFDRGLAYCLAQVRAALGDSADNPRFVQTLPRRGYKFIAPLESSPRPVPAVAVPVPASPPPAAEAPAAGRRALWPVVVALGVAATIGLLVWVAGRTTPRTIVAVSIFDNESGLSEHDRLVAGLADLVVTRLSELSPDRLGVVGNAAVLRQPRNIRNLKAVEAGVRADYVILGQLQKADGGLRVITHFIRLSDETHLKANRLSFPAGDVSGLEAAVVAEFERAVREHVLTPRRGA
jgi:DNA-binding winged helix-turn-helix (wHTH) protein/TolB-like protein